MAAATAMTVTMSAGPRAEVDTLNDMLSPADPPPSSAVPAPPDAPTRRPRRGWRAAGLVVCGVLAVLIVQVVVAAQMGTPWIAFEPGTATSTDGLLAVEGAQVYDDEGEILYLTVRQNRLTVLEWVVKARDPYIDIARERDLYPDRSRDEVRQANLDLMVRSKSDAELVALQHLGYEVFETVGAQVTRVVPGTAADGALEVNDVIVAVNGTRTPDSDTLVSVLRGFRPGDTVTLSLQGTDGSDRGTVDVTLGARPDGTEGGFLGIDAGTWYIESPDIPVHIDIDSGDVGGNSAGLAFTLSIIDALTPGSLVGGNKVAVTGTIQLDGSVGDVGGVAQKAVAARRAGAVAMLVPRNLEAEAKKYAGDMQIIPVSTLDEALEALANLGGNANELALPNTTAPN